ncbi:MAG: cytochrome c maturation protein CcmE [Dehalococcoidia bacterium]
MTDLLGSRRARLVAVLVVATAAISVLAFRAAGSSVSYYITPAEFAAEPSFHDARVRVAGRVLPDSVVSEAGRPVAFRIFGDEQDEVGVEFPAGVVPNLFGPYALVVVEGSGQGADLVHADSVIIKHENEFFSDMPPDDSISSHFVPEATATPTPVPTRSR